MPSFRSIKLSSYSSPPSPSPPCNEEPTAAPPPPPPPRPPCSTCQHKNHTPPPPGSGPSPPPPPTAAIPPPPPPPTAVTPPPPPPPPCKAAPKPGSTAPPPKTPPRASNCAPKAAPPRPSPPPSYNPAAIAPSPYSFPPSPASPQSIAPFAPPGGNGNHHQLELGVSLGGLFFLSFLALGLNHIFGKKMFVPGNHGGSTDPAGSTAAATTSEPQPSTVTDPRSNVNKSGQEDPRKAEQEDEQSEKKKKRKVKAHSVVQSLREMRSLLTGLLVASNNNPSQEDRGATSSAPYAFNNSDELEENADDGNPDEAADESKPHPHSVSNEKEDNNPYKAEESKTNDARKFSRNINDFQKKTADQTYPVEESGRETNDDNRDEPKAEEDGDEEIGEETELAEDNPESEHDKAVADDALKASTRVRKKLAPKKLRGGIAGRGHRNINLKTADQTTGGDLMKGSDSKMAKDGTAVGEEMEEQDESDLPEQAEDESKTDALQNLKQFAREGERLAVKTKPPGGRGRRPQSSSASQIKDLQKAAMMADRKFQPDPSRQYFDENTEKANFIMEGDEEVADDTAVDDDDSEMQSEAAGEGRGRDRGQGRRNSRNQTRSSNLKILAKSEKQVDEKSQSEAEKNAEETNLREEERPGTSGNNLDKNSDELDDGERDSDDEVDEEGDSWLEALGDFDSLGLAHLGTDLFHKWSTEVEKLVKRNTRLVYRLHKKINEREKTRKRDLNLSSRTQDILQANGNMTGALIDMADGDEDIPRSTNPEVAGEAEVESLVPAAREESGEVGTIKAEEGNQNPPTDPGEGEEDEESRNVEEAEIGEYPTEAAKELNDESLVQGSGVAKNMEAGRPDNGRNNARAGRGSNITSKRRAAQCEDQIGQKLQPLDFEAAEGDAAAEDEQDVDAAAEDEQDVDAAAEDEQDVDAAAEDEYNNMEEKINPTKGNKRASGHDFKTRAERKSSALSFGGALRMGGDDYVNYKSSEKGNDAVGVEEDVEKMNEDEAKEENLNLPAAIQEMPPVVKKNIKPGQEIGNDGQEMEEKNPKYKALVKGNVRSKSRNRAELAKGGMGGALVEKAVDYVGFMDPQMGEENDEVDEETLESCEVERMNDEEGEEEEYVAETEQGKGEMLGGVAKNIKARKQKPKAMSGEDQEMRSVVENTPLWLLKGRDEPNRPLPKNTKAMSGVYHKSPVPSLLTGSDAPKNIKAMSSALDTVSLSGEQGMADESFSQEYDNQAILSSVIPQKGNDGHKRGKNGRNNARAGRGSNITSKRRAAQCEDQIGEKLQPLDFEAAEGDAAAEDEQDVDAAAEDEQDVDAAAEDEQDVDAAAEDEQDVDAAAEDEQDVDAAAEDEQDVDAAAEDEQDVDAAAEDEYNNMEEKINPTKGNKRASGHDFKSRAERKSSALSFGGALRMGADDYVNYESSEKGNDAVGVEEEVEKMNEDEAKEENLNLPAAIQEMPPVVKKNIKPGQEIGNDGQEMEEKNPKYKALVKGNVRSKSRNRAELAKGGMGGASVEKAVDYVGFMDPQMGEENDEVDEERLESCEVERVNDEEGEEEEYLAETEQGKGEMLGGVAKNIKARKQKPKAMSGEEQEMRSVVENTPLRLLKGRDGPNRPLPKNTKAMSGVHHKSPVPSLLTGSDAPKNIKAMSSALDTVSLSGEQGMADESFSQEYDNQVTLSSIIPQKGNDGLKRGKNGRNNARAGRGSNITSKRRAAQCEDQIGEKLQPLDFEAAEGDAAAEDEQDVDATAEDEQDVDAAAEDEQDVDAAAEDEQDVDAAAEDEQDADDTTEAAADDDGAQQSGTTT